MNDEYIRLEKVNELIKIIGNCGRRFFYSVKHDRYAFIEIDQRGRLWFHDEYSGKRIYLHYRYWNTGFTHGGTLKMVINRLRDYVKTGKQLNSATFGPWPEWYCQGDLWGYKEDMKKVRSGAVEFGIISIQ